MAIKVPENGYLAIGAWPSAIAGIRRSMRLAVGYRGPGERLSGGSSGYGHGWQCDRRISSGRMRLAWL